MAEPIDIPGVYASLPDDTSSTGREPASRGTNTSSQDHDNVSKGISLQFSMESEPASNPPENQNPETHPNADFIRLVDQLPDDFVQPWGETGTRHFYGKWGEVISHVDIGLDNSRRLVEMRFQVNLSDGTHRRVIVSVKRDNWDWDKAVMLTTDPVVVLPTGPISRREPGDHVVELLRKDHQNVREGIKQALGGPESSVII